jgi:hypothetical protein
MYPWLVTWTYSCEVPLQGLYYSTLAPHVPLIGKVHLQLWSPKGPKSIARIKQCELVPLNGKVLLIFQ